MKKRTKSQVIFITLFLSLFSLKASANDDLQRAASKGEVKVIENALKDGSLSVDSKECLNMLLIATLQGHIDIVRLFLENGIDINSPLFSGLADPFVFSILGGHVNIVELFLEHGASSDRLHSFRDSHELTPILYAVANGGNIEIINLLIKNGADINKIMTKGHFEGMNAFMLAIYEWSLGLGNLDIINLLIKNGADVNRIITEGEFESLHTFMRTMSHIASYQDSPLQDSSLAEYGTYFHTPLPEGDWQGTTILMASVVFTAMAEQIGIVDLADQKEIVDLIQMLVAHGADVNLKADGGDFKGATVLQIAQFYKRDDIVAVLMENGALEGARQEHIPGFMRMLREETKDRMRYLYTMLGSYQVDYNNFPLKLSEFIKNKEYVDVDYCSAENCYDAWDNPFEYFSTKEDFTLISYGGDHAKGTTGKRFAADIISSSRQVYDHTFFNIPESRDEFIKAISKGDVQAVQHALDEGRSDEVNDFFNYGTWSDYTPLMVAVNQGQIDIVKLLVQYGADVNLINEENETALSIALKEKHNDIAIFLLEHGGDMQFAAKPTATPIPTSTPTPLPVPTSTPSPRPTPSPEPTPTPQELLPDCPFSISTIKQRRDYLIRASNHLLKAPWNLTAQIQGQSYVKTARLSVEEITNTYGCERTASLFFREALSLSNSAISRSNYIIKMIEEALP